MRINLEEFEVIAPIKKKKNKQVVSVFGDGVFAVNKEVIQVMKTNCFEIYLDRKDCSRMLLVPNGEVVTDMGKTYRIKNYGIAERLSKKRIKLPAYYVGSWNEESECWVGELSVLNPNKSGGRIKK